MEVFLGKVSVFAGESGSGKSFICAGNLVKNAQEQGWPKLFYLTVKMHLMKNGYKH